jgi:phospholipid-binding lipoprotein MlaA
MKLACEVYLFSALCLIFLPGPCAGSSSFEVSVSVSPLDEGNQITIAKESPEPLSEGKSPESLPPVERSFSANQEDEPNRITDENTASKPSEPEEPVGIIADPLESVNRAFFSFNDKLYFWVLKPIATGYKTIIPEDGRIGVRNFFSNLTTPVRLVNCLLQANPKCAGTETLRFVLNTTIGVAGFFDPARKRFNLEKQDKDFGQTLGIWGMGPVFYIDLPILGPSSLRDGLGFAVDASFNPQTYLAIYFVFVGYVNTGGWILEKINEASLTIGEYEDLKKAALDPYIALREAYSQYRQNKIRGK